MKRIGMLTSGGDCQALNAAMRGVAKGLLNSGNNIELFGFIDGYKGLIYGNYKVLVPTFHRRNIKRVRRIVEVIIFTLFKWGRLKIKRYF